MSQTMRLPTQVAVFPLPEVVLFPLQVLPLHVFEPRYRAMIKDALAGRRYIAVAQLRGGFERQYFTRSAPIYPVVGVGRIVESQRLPDGRYNVALLGQARARILREYTNRPYRVAELSPLPTVALAADDEERQHWRSELRVSLLDNLSLFPPLRNAALRTLDQAPQIETAADLVAAELPLPGPQRQALLEATDAQDRIERLLRMLDCLGAALRRSRRRFAVTPCQLN